MTVKRLEWCGVTAALALTGGNLNEVIGGDSIVNRADQGLLMAILVAAFPLLIIRLRVVGRAFQGDRLLLILLAFIVISCSWSISPLRSVALASVLCFTTTMAVYIGVRFTLGEIKGAVICSLCLIMVGTVLFTVVSPGNAFMQDGHAGALRGFYSQKNTLARSMALAVPLIFSSLVAAKQLPKRLVLLGLFAMAVLLLLATRSATGALVAGGLLMAHPMTSLFKARRYLAASALILVLSLIAIGTVSLVRNVENVSVALGRDPTLTGRTIVWTIAIRDIAARPLVGYGFRGYWLGWEGPSANVWSAGVWNPNDSHNGLLDVLLDLGAVGAILLVLHVTKTLTTIVRGYRLRDGEYHPWALVVLGHFLLYNVTESTVLRPTNLVWLIYIAVSVGICIDFRTRSRISSKTFLPRRSVDALSVVDEHQRV